MIVDKGGKERLLFDVWDSVSIDVVILIVRLEFVFEDVVFVLFIYNEDVRVLGFIDFIVGVVENYCLCVGKNI